MTDDRLDTPTRAKVKLHLRRYLFYRALVDGAVEKVSEAYSPPTTRQSQIGSQKGRPGNPTLRGAAKMLDDRPAVAEAHRMVEAIERVMGSCTRREAMMVRLVYFHDDEGERGTLLAAAKAVGIGNAVAWEWHRELLWRFAVAMGLA